MIRTENVWKNIKTVVPLPESYIKWMENRYGKTKRKFSKKKNFWYYFSERKNSTSHTIKLHRQRPCLLFGITFLDPRVSLVLCFGG